MPDVMQQVNDLKSLPDQALQFELTNPSGAAPAYLVLAEAQRRQLMRQAAQTQQNQAPMGSVYDDVIRSMMARQPPPGIGPAGMTPPPAAPPAAPQTPQNFRPPARMAEGGEVDGDDDDAGGGDDYPVTQMPLRFNLDDAIERVAQEHGRDPDEYRAIIKAESNNNPNAVSPRGATGLMQIMPDTGRQYGARNLKDPWQNLNAGANFLDSLHRRYGDNFPLILAAWNAGPGNVEKYHGVPPFQETHNFIKNVASNLSQLQDKDVQEEDPALTPPPKEQAENAAEQHAQNQPFLDKQFLTAPKTSVASGLASLEPPDVQAGGPSETPDVPALDVDPRIGMPVAPPPAAAAARQTEPQLMGGPDPNAAPGAGAAPGVRPATAETAPDAFADLRQKVQKMWDEQEAIRHPSRKQLLLRMLGDFGAGMAQSTRPGGAAVMAGVSGMSKAMQADPETARQNELKLMGVSAEIDKAVQQNQLEGARLRATGQNEAYKSHDEMWAKADGAVMGGPGDSPGAGYQYEPFFMQPGRGVWHLGTQGLVTRENQEFLPIGPDGQKPAIGSTLPMPVIKKADDLWTEKQKEAIKAAEKTKTASVADQDRQNNAYNWAMQHPRAAGQEPWDLKDRARLYQQTQEDPTISPEDKRTISLTGAQTETNARLDQQHQDQLANQAQTRRDRLDYQTREDEWRRQVHADNQANVAQRAAAAAQTHTATVQNQLDTARNTLSNGISKQFWTPADNIVNRTNTLLHNVEYGNMHGDEVTDSLLVPQLLVAEVGGQGSGVRITRSEIENVLHGRSTIEDFQMMWKKALTGAQLSDQQRDQIRDLVNYIHLKAVAKRDSADYWDQQLGQAGSRKEQLDMMNRLRHEQGDLDEHPFAVRDEQGNLHAFSSQMGLEQYQKQPRQAAPAAAATPATPATPAANAPAGARTTRPAQPPPEGRVWMFHPSVGWRAAPADKVKDKLAQGWTQ